MKEQGHDVAIFNNYGLEGSNTDWNGIPVYQRGADLYSNDVVPAHMHDWTMKDQKQPHILLHFMMCGFSKVHDGQTGMLPVGFP